MRLVVDSSTLISLAWAGQLGVLPTVPAELVLIEAVYHEAVREGLAGGHADAAAIEQAVVALQRRADPAGNTVDAMVIEAAAEMGAVVTNDLVLGRRAVNQNANWLRTADLVILASKAGSLSVARARVAVTALHHAGRLTDELRDRYLEELT